MPSRRAFLRAGGALAAAPWAAACNDLLGPTPADSNWTVQERGRFIFYTRPASFAAGIVDQLYPVLDDQYSVAAAMLDVRFSARVSMFLYSSGADAGLFSDHSGVAYADTQAVRAVCVPPFDANLMALLSHEFNHVLTRNTLGQPGTYFMNEGIATAVIGERFHNNGRHLLFPWTAARLNQVPSLTTLVDDDQWSGTSEDVAYKTSASFLAWLLDTHGSARLKQIFTARSSEMQDRVRSRTAGRSTSSSRTGRRSAPRILARAPRPGRERASCDKPR